MSLQPKSASPTVLTPPRRPDGISQSVPPKEGAAAASSAPSPRSDLLRTPYLECSVSESNPDGSVHVTFLMPADVTRRMRLRAGKVPLEVYLWENVLHAAVEAHVF